MSKRVLLTALIALTVFFVQSALSSQASATGAEDTKSRPNKQEIVDLIAKVNQMPGQQQKSKIDKIIADQAGSKTPRSDFLFCTGLAYLGNAKAQACVARAYESGLGVVEDLSEAYTWYALACEARIADASEAQKLEEARDRARDRLVSAYPHPTEEDLEDQVNAQKTKIVQYLAEVKKNKK